MCVIVCYVQIVTWEDSSVVTADIVFRERFAVTVAYNVETPATSSTADQVSAFIKRIWMNEWMTDLCD